MKFRKNLDTYDCGFPFSQDLTIPLDELWERRQINKASLIIVDGAMGDGKTTLSIHLADYYNAKAGFPKMSFEDQLGKGGAEFQEKLRICYEKHLPACVYDEAGDFNKRGSMTKFNAFLNQTFETFRAFRVIPILCLPDFNALDNSLLAKGVPRLLIHVYNRNNNYGCFKAYSARRIYYIKAKLAQIIVKPQVFSIIHPNFHGQFLNLPKDRAAELEAVTIKKKIEMLRASETKAQGLYTIKGIADSHGKTKASVQMLVLRHKILPRKKINKTNYYDQEQYDQITDRML